MYNKQAQVGSDRLNWMETNQLGPNQLKKSGAGLDGDRSAGSRQAVMTDNPHRNNFESNCWTLI